MKAQLVLIETGGNQDFIFSTNKLRQNIGASELIHRIGTRFVLEAVRERVPAYAGPLQHVKSTAKYVAELDRVATEHPFGNGTPVEVLVATSGKAVLLVDGPETGKAIIEHVTLKALKEAPGAVVRGVVDDEGIDLDAEKRSAVHKRMKDIHKRINSLRLDLPPPEARFPVLPISALCPTSGLPIERRVRYSGRRGVPERIEALAEPAFKKEAEAPAGWERVTAALQNSELAKGIDRLEKMGLDWLGVVHADGNGFGKTFLNLPAHMPDDVSAYMPHDPGSARAYCTFYRKLSLALDLAGVTALQAAIPIMQKMRVEMEDGEDWFRPIVPMVFGGDDLTVICDGRQAVRFARSYLDAFEDATAMRNFGDFQSVIPDLLDRPSESDTAAAKKRFGGAAGIAIVKPHHPFHRAYRLAEELIRGAKSTKTRLGDAVSSLDFQVVYQDAASNLDKLRAGWRMKERYGSTRASDDRSRCNVWLDARPYVVSKPERYTDATGRNREWADRHRVDILARAVKTLPPEGDEKGLPRSQQHALRSALFQGLDIANARLALVRQRYEKRVEWEVLGDERVARNKLDNLFFLEPTDEKLYRTRFLDALELIDIKETLS